MSQAKTRNYVRIEDKEKGKTLNKSTRYPQIVKGKLTFKTSDGKSLEITHSSKTDIRVTQDNDDKLDFYRLFHTISIAKGTKKPNSWLIYELQKGYLCTLNKTDLKQGIGVLLRLLREHKRAKAGIDTIGIVSHKSKGDKKRIIPKNEKKKNGKGQNNMHESGKCLKDQKNALNASNSLISADSGKTVFDANSNSQKSDSVTPQLKSIDFCSEPKGVNNETMSM